MNFWRQVAERFEPLPEKGVSDMLGIYTIYDRKGEAYMGLMTYSNDSVASRSLRLEFEQKPLQPIVKFPDDYDLFCLGAYDEHSGEIRPFFPGRLVCSCRMLVTHGVEKPKGES